MTTSKKNPAHDVIAALLAEHRYAARLLDVLDRQLRLASRGQAIDREAVRAVMHYMTGHPDAYHHPREDAMFARLEKRDPRLRKPIAAIERAHRTLGAAGRELLAIAGREAGPDGDESELAERISAYVSAQREHMTIEEHDLFPRARQLLDGADLAAIERDFRRATDPIFEASVRDAYAAYPTLVRMLVEVPAARQLLDAFDSLLDSASTLGGLLFGGAPKAPAVGDGEGERSPAERSLTAR